MKTKTFEIEDIHLLAECCKNKDMKLLVFEPTEDERKEDKSVVASKKPPCKYLNCISCKNCNFGAGIAYSSNIDWNDEPSTIQYAIGQWNTVFIKEGFYQRTTPFPTIWGMRNNE